jgi:hypothetical protein
MLPKKPSLSNNSCSWAASSFSAEIVAEAKMHFRSHPAEMKYLSDFYINNCLFYIDSLVLLILEAEEWNTK